MTFQSLEYLVFLPVVFIIYWTVCSKSKTLQNILLIIASLIFYGWCDWRFLGLLLLTAISTYYAGLLISKTDSQKKRKIISALTIALNLGILFFFKYFNFFIQSFVDIVSILGFTTNITSLKIILPVGISFYTFTALSYSIDVYQKKVAHTSDILAYFAYVLFFPSILSGPINRAQKQLPQYFVCRCFDYKNVVNACKLLLTGLIMKLCLADRLGIYVDAVYANIAQHNGTTLLFTSILYSIQIYADFAGYSLLAIGSGKLFGIELPINFLRPYFAKTITDFWRRWHISLTTWFRDYIYFPLGGNRCSKIRWMFNTMIVFTVSGLWHGASYNFIIWGIIHGFCMIIERLVYGEKIKTISNKLSIANLLRIMLTFTIVNFAWVFFRINNISDTLCIFKKVFTEHGRIFMDADTLVYAFVFAILVFSADFMDEYFSGKIKLLNSKNTILRWSTYIVMIIMILLFGVLDGGSFIYFQF